MMLGMIAAEAYTCLKDPDQRAAYNVLLATQRRYRAVRPATQQGTDIRAGQRQARGRQSSQPYPDNDDSSSGSGCAQPRSKARSAPQQYTQHRARQESRHGRSRDWRRMEEERQEQRMWERWEAEERRSVAQRQEDEQCERERRRQSDDFWAGLAEMGHIIHIVEGYQSERQRRRQRWWSRLMFWRRR
jgi:hypothetical protein